MSDETQVAAMISATLQAFGRLDYAFNNAAIIGDETPLAVYAHETWDRVIAVNLTGVWQCMQHEIRQMLTNGGGSIVNTDSIAGFFGSPAIPAYSVSKWGVLGMTRAAARTYGKDGIRVNAVCPGHINAPMLGPILKDEERLGRLTAQYPLRRIGQPAEIAEADHLALQRLEVFGDRCFAPRRRRVHCLTAMRLEPLEARILTRLAIWKPATNPRRHQGGI